MNDKLKKDPSVIHCKVMVSTVSNPTTGEIEYVADYDPKVLEVNENDTILVFKLAGKTPADVRIASVKPVQEDNTQLSPASISKNGKMATLSDINTERDTFNLKFQFAKSEQAPSLLKICSDSDVDYPEIDNNPPIPPA
jgi:hypothetical protein